jgi:hypothetical protein
VHVELFHWLHETFIPKTICHHFFHKFPFFKRWVFGVYYNSGMIGQPFAFDPLNQNFHINVEQKFVGIQIYHTWEERQTLNYVFPKVIIS